MLEQEIASIIKFVLDSTGNPTPYYYNVPQSFQVPAAYFPRPEIETAGDTLSSYEMSYSWHINFFDTTTEEAYDKALLALTAIKQRRNLIPLIDVAGAQLTSGIRVKDPSLKPVDACAAQLTVNFISRRSYTRPTAAKMQNYETAFELRRYQSTLITEAMEEAISRYL